MVEMEGETPKIKLNPKVPALLPKPEDRAKINVRYMLISPYAAAHIHWDAANGELIYDIEEPLLDVEEKFLLERVKDEIKEAVNEETLSGKNIEDLIAYLDKTARWAIEGMNTKISEKSYRKLFYYLYRDLIGLNEIEPLMRDDFVEEIEYNGINHPIFAIHRIYGSIKTNLTYRDLSSATGYSKKLAGRCGESLTAQSPAISCVMPDGSSLDITYSSEIASKGPVFSIKKIGNVSFTPTRLIDMNVLSPEILSYLWILLERKMNVLIVGNPGSGKTSLLNSLKLLMPSDASFATVEGSSKLSEEEISAETDYTGKIKEIVKGNPDYIFAESLSPKETLAMFQGMIADIGVVMTLDASNSEGAIKKLLSEPIGLSPAFVNNIDAIITISKEKVDYEKVCRVSKIDELLEVTLESEVKTHKIFFWESSEDKFFFRTDSRVFEKIAARYGLQKDELIEEFNNRAELMLELNQRKLIDVEKVKKAIKDYYAEPEKSLAKFGIA